MLHTFFLTVLSIDCQRLELADLLHQGTQTLATTSVSNGSAVSETQSSKNPGTLFSPIKAAATRASLNWILGVVRRARKARSGSLILVSVVGWYESRASHHQLTVMPCDSVHLSAYHFVLRQRGASLAVDIPGRLVRLQRRATGFRRFPDVWSTLVGIFG
jgi:hypothetical protein